jgi:hypothetical protein
MKGSVVIMAKDTMFRKTTCLGCGFSLEKIASRYLFKKEWNANHFAYHQANYTPELCAQLWADYQARKAS